MRLLKFNPPTVRCGECWQQKDIPVDLGTVAMLIEARITGTVSCVVVAHVQMSMMKKSMMSGDDANVAGTP